MNLTLPELRILLYCLDYADDRMSSAGCNDFREIGSYFPSRQALEDFNRKYHEWNGDPEEFDPRYLELPDFAACGYLRNLVRKEILKRESAEVSA